MFLSIYLCNKNVLHTTKNSSLYKPQAVKKQTPEICVKGSTRRRREIENGDIYYLYPCGHLFHDCIQIQS